VGFDGKVVPLIDDYRTAMIFLEAVGSELHEAVGLLDRFLEVHEAGAGMHLRGLEALCSEKGHAVR
jgi:hypothetical protein